MKKNVMHKKYLLLKTCSQDDQRIIEYLFAKRRICFDIPQTTIQNLLLIFLGLIIFTHYFVNLSYGKSFESELQLRSSSVNALASIEDVLGDFPSTEEKQQIQMVLTKAFSQEYIASENNFVRSKKVHFISARSVAFKALQKNLHIKLSQYDTEMSRQAIVEAAAVFDPVLSLSFSFSEADSRNRSKTVPLVTKKFQPGLPLAIPVVPNSAKPQVVELGWKNQNFGVKEVKEIFASKAPDVEPAKSRSLNIGFYQHLPWGTELSVAMATSAKKVFYDAHGNSYGAPFSSAMSLQFQTPLPYSKGFGKMADAEYKIKQSTIENQISYWTVKAMINQIIGQADGAFWRVVRAFETLQVAIYKRKMVEEQLALSKKHYDQRLATEYDLRQIEMQLSQAVYAQRAALSALISSSYSVAVLIEDAPDTLWESLYLPYGYSQELKIHKKELFDAEMLYESAISKRAELARVSFELEQSILAKKKSANQLKPDVLLSVFHSVSQDASVYGYKTLDDSLINIIDPDSSSSRVSITYKYPIGNRALMAQYDNALVNIEMMHLSADEIKAQVSRELHDALAKYQTSVARITSAKESLGFAHLAHERLSKRYKNAETSQFEWILSMQTLMVAKLSHVTAMIDHRTALSDVYTAEGSIEQIYMGKVASNPLDRLRLAKLLADSSMMFFTQSP